MRPPVRLRGLLLIGLALAAGTLAAPRRAASHDYPAEITVEVERSVKFQVKDAATCPAKVVAYIVNPDPLVSVTPDEGYGVTVEFTVSAFSTPGDEIIVVEWIGKDALNGTDGPCQEISGQRPILVHVVAPPKEGSSASTPNSGKSGDPVDTFTGELVFTEEPDLDMGGPLPLRFTRNYASKMRINFVVGNLGDNWRHDFEWSVHSAGTLATLVTPKGKVLKYLREGDDWNLQSATDSPVRLAREGSGWVCLDPADDLLRSFDGSGRMTSVEDGRGNVLLLDYEEDGHLERVVEDAPPSTARSLVFSHDGGGRVAGVTEYWGASPGRSVSYAYDGDDLVSFTDAAGGVTGYTYDPDHADPALLLHRTSPRGNVPWHQTWDDVGKVAVQTDAHGNEWTFDFGNPYKPGTTKQTRPDGKVEVHVHDRAGFLVSAENGAGERVSIGDDGGAPRRASIEDGSGAATGTVFDPASGLVTTSVDALGRETTFTWTERSAGSGFSRRDLVRIDHPDGTHETMTRDAAGNMTSRTDEEGNTWSYTFDGRGNPLTETDPLGRTVTHAWNGWGDLVSTTDEAGNTTSFTYDARHRLARVDRPDGTFVTMTHDALDRLVAETDGEGRERTNSWDANGNLVGATDYTGVSMAWTYDGMDRVVEAEDAGGGTSEASYDVVGRIGSLTDRTGGATTRVYDAADREVSLVDPMGRAWGVEYDGAGRETATILPSGREIRYDRNAAGEVERVTSPSGRARWSTLDARGRFVRSIDGAGRVTRRILDGRGLPSAVVVGGGAVAAAYEWDDAGRLVGLADGNGSAWTIGRDLRGLPSSRTDPLGRTTTISFDAMGRAGSHLFPGGLGELDIDRDGAGRVVQRSFDDGPTLAFAHDGEGRLLSATGAAFTWDSRGLLASSNGMAVTRDGEGRLLSSAAGAGKTVTYGRDAAGRVTSVSDWAGGTLTYQRDVDGRVTGITRSNGVATTFTLDDDGNVIGIREGTLAESRLVRDGNGDVVEAERTAPLVADLGEGNESDPELDAGGQSDQASYDALGRTVESGVLEFEWDLASRLTALNGSPSSRTWTYDAFGLPLSGDDDGGAIERDIAWNYAHRIPVPASRTVDGATTWYVHGPDGNLLWSVDGTGARRWYHFDEAGNTLFLTDDAGAVTDAYAHDPWGRLQSSTGSTDNPFTFCGRWGAMAEGFGDLYRMRLRIYDARARRFLTREPLTERIDPADLAAYAYAGGDPLRACDPTGEDPQPAGGASMSSTDIAGKGNTAIGVLVEVGQRQMQRIPNLALTAANEATNTRLAKAGNASSAFGTGLEIYNANKKMNQSFDSYSERNEATWAWVRMMLAEMNRLYREKRFTLEQMRNFRRAVFDARDARLKASDDRLWTETLSTSSVMALNSFTGLIPGAGLFIDWGDPNSFLGSTLAVDR